MIYTMKYTGGRRKIDTERIAKKFVDGGQLYVHASEEEDRVALADYLEAEGFRFETGRQNVMTVRLPLVIEMSSKSVSAMGNVTSAAAAAGSGVVMSDKDFYLLHSVYKLQNGRR